MKHIISSIALAASALIFSSCGSVSEVAPTTGATVNKYSKVVVKDFAYKGDTSEVNGPASSTTFPRIIASEVTKKGAFTSVSQNGKAGSDSLIITGDVTRYVAGNAALRMMVGFGAGSSYFDADVRFIDGASGKVIGTMKADKNSWGLGGGLASGQTPETFMQGSAKKIAEESFKFSKKAAN
jgi:hypothetical protein